MCRERLFSGKDITMTVFLFADEYFGVNVYFFVVKTWNYVRFSLLYCDSGEVLRYIQQR